jgi:hypothetical protein
MSASSRIARKEPLRKLSLLMATLAQQHLSIT